MLSKHSKWWIAGLLVLSLIVSGCGAATPGAGQSTSTLSQSVLPTPVVPPTAAPTSTPESTSTPAPTLAPIQLTVLHTNDNWGETEPCG